MADLNSSQQIRFENGGLITLNDGADNAIFEIVEGTLEVAEGGEELYAQRDRGAFTGEVLEGDERMSTLRFDVRLTQEGLGASDLRGKLMPANASGQRPKFAMNVVWPDHKGATVGQQVDFADCFCETPPVISASGAGAEPDRIRVEIMSLDSRGTWSDYTAA